MPMVMRIGPYRFFFYSNEGSEPMHIHVKSDENEAKFWLEPIQLVWNHGYNERRLKEVQTLIEENHATLVAAWREYFGA